MVMGTDATTDCFALASYTVTDHIAPALYNTIFVHLVTYSL